MRSVLVLCLGVASVAHALPSAGEIIVPFNVYDTHGATRTLPDLRYPIIVIYEDEKASKQNERADKFVDQTTSLRENSGKVEGIAVADLEKWNWFPAKKFALAEVRRIETKIQSPLYVDFPGELRKRWGLAKSKSSILVISSSGLILFSAEGALSDAQLQSLGDTLKSCGVTLPR